MKLRIRGNSIRLRLGRSEVLRMIQTGAVRESTTFDLGRRQRLEYALVSDANASAVFATFDDGRMVVRVPTDQVVAWGMTDQLGIDAIQRSSDGLVLRIVIEKDLECTDDPTEGSQGGASPGPEHELACSPATIPAAAVTDGLYARNLSGRR